MKVATNIHFLLGRDDVPYFIAGCDILLHPARSENTGTVILEALVGGLPEIATAECGYAFYIAKAQTGIILTTPFKQEKFNEQLKQALDKNLLQTWSNNAKQFSDKNNLSNLSQVATNIIATK